MNDEPTQRTGDPSVTPGHRESVPGGRGRTAEWLLPGGSEPDPRFTLANERTFLAWVRTALAFMAAGIAVEAFTADLFIEPVRKAVAVFLLLLGALVSSGAAARWVNVERSMRHKRPLPMPLIVPFLSIGAAVAAVFVMIFVFLA